jgi:hypothetical protein
VLKFNLLAFQFLEGVILILLLTISLPLFFFLLDHYVVVFEVDQERLVDVGQLFFQLLLLVRSQE